MLDVPVLGEAECRRRVLASWRRGATLHTMPDGRWALRLPEPVHVRAELAPGVPLELASDDVLRWSWRGRSCSAPIGDLPLVDLAHWVDLSGLVVEHLAAVEQAAPAPVAVADAVPAEPAVDLAARAGVRPGRRRDGVAAELAERAAPAHRGAGSRGPGTGERVPGPRSDLLARLVLRAPGGRLMARRHARYVADLARQFEAGRYDEALRRAIALGGGVGGLSLRLPRTREGALRPHTGPQHAGRSVALDAGTVQAALGRHYEEAAARLERDGRIDEAAYVLADLLDRPLDAVRMLERQERLALAAELAESRALPAEVAIRLWWKLGQHGRALGIARRRGGFAQVAALLGPDEDLAWRGEWVRHCRDLGDPSGAVRAAWPQPSLRDEVQGDLASAMSLGGPEAAEMFALAVSHRPTAAAVAAAVELLETPASAEEHERPGEHDGRPSFVDTLGTWPVGDPVVDRRLATAAARLLVRDPDVVADLPDARRKTLLADLHRRADPLAVADLARRGPVRRPDRAARHSLVLAGRGELPILDAAVVRSGVLVAHGGFGTRLYGPSGQVRARWDVPADRLVVADHGAVALLVVGGGRSTELHRLDLVTRRTARWAVVDVRRTATTFDGASLVVVDDGGLAAWDVTGESPKVLWRQRLAPGERVLDLARSSSSLAATIRADGSGELEPGVQLWRWSLPDGLLRARGVVDLGVGAVVSAGLTADGALLTTTGDDGVAFLRRHTTYGQPTRTRLDDGSATLVDAGACVAVVTASQDGVLVSGDRVVPLGAWSVLVQGSDPVRVRQSSRSVVVCSWDGRVLAFDAASGRVEARFAART
ncbi:hypothetical protein Cch01nite_00050 [Cellulomonas chitinilytica]|uniref:MoxR-vWA-beta-propeller ternary system domain-containing protein n=1 Tax=Cellulomonas chitinilytica TaxID=398759 RepID=A0A919TZC2_9CELL|nr:hypothetical protein Cch01nite_00050 [Cellulomonas chitinilytica]